MHRNEFDNTVQTLPESGAVGAGTAECKHPKNYLVRSHSSRLVHLSDEITSRELVLSMIQAQYHIYHTDLSGYLAGGAMVQDVLTKYALGGTPKDLYQTYKRFRQDKERIPPAPTITITARNWRDWLGHKSYYHDYLDFFDQELRQLEAKTIKQWSSSPAAALGSGSTACSLSASWSALSSSPLAVAMAKMVSDYLTPLVPGLCASTGPLIHLGYGVEFGSRLATAEGLAYACISYQPATTCFISTTSSWEPVSASSSPGSSASSVQKRSPTVTILNMIRNDKRLDGMFDAGFQAKLNVVMSSRVSLLKSYLGMWSGQARFLVKVLPSEKEKEQLLKAIWMSLVATYVVLGRPKITTALSEQESNIMTDRDEDDDGQEHNAIMGTIDLESNDILKIATGRWKSLFQEAIHADHPIVSKIVRSLWRTELVHGKYGGLFYETAVRAIGEDPASDESTGPGF
ncbi:hypothetical protein BGZ65_001991 [Modicella reniformis]|uniref:Uncharacterized protein n=1 Tax=Modicella reniformis TaxID=1440133 RepID=A0A9P6ILZ6_9FUNG|nr:hypothetical protein BGZ65_001991 [Modicella reniformis]